MSNPEPTHPPSTSYWQSLRFWQNTRFLQNPRVQTVLPFATSVAFHVVLVALGILIMKTVEVIRNVSIEQIIIPDTNLVENADNGGVKNPGINADPTRAAEQNVDDTVNESTDWSNRKSETLNTNLVSGSADVQQNITPIGAGANVGGAVSGLDTRGVGDASGNLAPFGPAGGGGEGQGQGMFGLPGGNVKKVVYVSDASGSMFGQLQTLLDYELKNSIDRLRPSQLFNIVFFREDKPALIQDQELLFATPANKARAYEFLKNYAKGGRTNALPALQAAFNMKPKPDLIFLLTDGLLDSPDQVVALIDRLNADRKTRVNTILFVDRIVKEEESKTLKEIATANGGTFKLVRAADLLR